MTTTAYDALDRPTQTADVLGHLATVVYDAGRKEKCMVALTTWYCLADIAAAHFWTGDGFIPAEDYSDFAAEVPHFAARQDAEAAARWMREQYRCHLRVMAVRPGCRPTCCDRR